MFNSLTRGSSPSVRRPDEAQPDEEIELNKSSQRLMELRTYFKDKQLIKRINSLEKSNEVSIDGARSMAESFGELGKSFALIEDDPEAAALGATWQKIGEFWSSLQADRDKADRALTKYVNTPFLVVQQDLTEAEAAKKDHDRTVTAYANAKAKVAKIKGAKKLDQTKLHEAEKEEQDCKENFESSVDETAVAFKKLLGNDEKYLAEELCMGYLDAMEKYMLTGQEKVNELVEELNQIKPGLVDPGKQTESRSMKTVDIKGYTDKMRKTLVSLQKEKEKEKEKEISDPVERRYRALQNLQKLEQNYLARLALILDNKNAVGYGCSKDPKLAEKVTEADRQAIFYQIPQIHALHTTIGEAVRKAVKEHPKECLGRELLPTVDKWQCYTMFAFSHYAAEDTLEKKMEHKSFKALIQGDLLSLLTSPLSHAKDLLECLQIISGSADDASQDHKHLQAVIKAIKEIEKELDASNDFSAEMRRLIVIQNSLSGFEGNLVEPARRLLREATFPMIAPLSPGEEGSSGSSSSWMSGSTDGRATYRFWLFNDCIVFATEGTSSAGQALRFLNVSSAVSKLKFAGRFSLQGLRIEDMEDTQALYNAFQIIPLATSPAASLVPTISGGREEPRYTLILPTFADKKDWLTELQNAIDRISKYKVFGVPLDRLMKNNPREKGRTVPYLVEVCAEFLHSKSVAVQGLFRESGSGAEIEKKKVLVDLGNELVLPASENDHNVTGLLKMWIRDLPDPLLTYGHYPEWIELGNRVVSEKESGGNMSRLLPHVQKLILALPETNRYVMQVLFKLLSCVAQHKDSNLMSPSNLAIVFSPILLVNKMASPFDTSDFKASNAVITVMIDYYEPIFSDIEKERDAKEKQRTPSQ